MRHAVVVLVVVAMALPALSYGDPFEDAMTALEATDYVTAAKLLEPLAETGHPNAQYQLGALYLRGLGLAEDPPSALVWFRAAAQQGFAPAQFNLAAMYYEGRGVAQDYVRAAMWNGTAIATASPDTVDPYRRFGEALQTLMTPEQIVAAATATRACIDASFKGCD